MQWIPFNLITLMTMLIFVGFAVWARFREEPMHFWAGSTVDPESITDIKKHNAAHSKMWLGYCVPMLVSMIIAPFNFALAGIILGVGVVAGLPILIFVHEKVIKRKYHITKPKD